MLIFMETRMFAEPVKVIHAVSPAVEMVNAVATPKLMVPPVVVDDLC
jgi:hypothetical protein